MKYTKCLSIVFCGYNPGLVIHHKNFDKTDNRLSNLSYLTREQHTKLHHTGKILSEKTKSKISTSRIGTPGYWTGKKRPPFSAEAKENMGKSHQKKVFCLQLNKIFDSIKQAAQELSLNQCNITNCCRGKRKTAGGYHFAYYFD